MWCKDKCLCYTIEFGVAFAVKPNCNNDSQHHCKTNSDNCVNSSIHQNLMEVCGFCQSFVVFKAYKLWIFCNDTTAKQ